MRSCKEAVASVGLGRATHTGVLSKRSKRRSLFESDDECECECKKKCVPFVRAMIKRENGVVSFDERGALRPSFEASQAES